MKKLSFIIYKKNDKNYKVLISSLTALNIPNNVHVDIVTLTGDGGIPVIYNQGISASIGADYRVYINDGIEILEKNFISIIIDLFERNSEIGIIGCIGTKIIPPTGICENAQTQYGKIIIGNEKKIWNDFSNEYVEVASVNGLLMAVRGNVLWRDDLFKGNSFWDISQCIEYKRRGYKSVVIASPNKFYIKTSELNYEADEQSRQIFLAEYSKDIFPLVTIIIPTYNRPEYFKIALESVLNQTYKNLDIFITDNSTNDFTEELMINYLEKDKRIVYVHNKNFTALDNWNCARNYNNPKAEYVNWLMDDDVFHPQKIEIMMGYYLVNHGVSLITSYRKLIDKDGNIMPDLATTKKLSSTTIRYNGLSAGKTILSNLENIVGEPTTVLIKKKYLNNNDLGWQVDGGKYFISDFPTWLNLLSKGDMIYIADELSYFRCHSGQDQLQLKTQIYSIIRWLMEVQYAINNRIFLLEEKDIRKTLFQSTIFVITALRNLEITREYESERKILENILQSIGNSFINGYMLDFNIDINSGSEKNGRV